MITLCIRYTLNPSKLADFKTYVNAEQGPIGPSGMVAMNRSFIERVG